MTVAKGKPSAWHQPARQLYRWRDHRRDRSSRPKCRQEHATA